MGITALLPLVSPACRNGKVSEFHGATVGVDVSSWLHKALFGCGHLVARGKSTDMYVRYCVSRVRMLLKHNIRVLLVFDGASLPAKRETNAARKERKRTTLEKAKKLLHEGKNKEADELFRRCGEVTFDMVVEVIRHCASIPNVYCLVAPYEADAQLCHLNRTGLIDMIISEDSDLILFGCTKVMFKMDIDGRGQLFDSSRLPLVLSDRLDFVSFRRACILSGCDYASNLRGVGLKKSLKFFSSINDTDPNKFLKSLPDVLNMKSVVVTEAYIKQFIEAENTFLYQLVFDPNECRQLPLNPYPDGSESVHYPYAGRLSDETVALLLASGNMNPFNFEILQDPVQPDPHATMQLLCQRHFITIETIDSTLSLDKRRSCSKSRASPKSPLASTNAFCETVQSSYFSSSFTTSTTPVKSTTFNQFRAFSQQAVGRAKRAKRSTDENDDQDYTPTKIKRRQASSKRGRSLFPYSPRT